MATIRNFTNKGIDTKDSPFDLDGFALNAENLNITKGFLTPHKDLGLYRNDREYKEYFYQFKDTIIDFDNYTFFLEYKDLLLYSNDNGGFKYDGTNSYTLGIDKPTDITITTDTGNLTGDYQYAYTYYNSSDNTESIPVLSDYVSLDNNNITISVTASTNAQVDKIRIYRIGGSLTDFTLVDTIDNSTTTYTDNTADSDIAGNHIMDSKDNSPYPVGAKQLIYTQGIIVSYKEDKLIWSKIGNPNYWPAANYIEFESNITGIGVIASGLLIFLANKTYIIQGTSPELFTKFLLSNDQGCKTPKSIRYVNNYIVWVSDDGICTTNGGQVQILSLDLLDKINLGVVSSGVIDSKYFVLLDNGKTLVADFRFGKAFYYLSYDNISNIQQIKSLDLLLFYNANDKYLYKLDGDTNLSFTYLSPKYSDGTLSRLKYYQQIYLAYKGNLYINVYIDDNLVLSTDITRDLIKLPATKQRGKWIQFEIQGTGDLYELSYKVTKENDYGIQQ